MNKFLMDLKEAPNSVTKVATIFYWGRSGSYLLQSLLDNHPEVLTIPPYILANRIEEITKYMDSNSNIKNAELISNYIVDIFESFFTIDQHNEKIIDCIDNEGNSALSKIDKSFFHENLFYILNKAEKNNSLDTSILIKSLFITYAICINRDNLSTKNPILIFQGHDPSLKISIKLKEIFYKNELFFLTCVRFPEKTLDSHFHHFIHEVENAKIMSNLPRFLIHQLISNDIYYKAINSSHHLAIRFEDMHNKTESLMRQLSKLLGITWDQSLMQSTLDGKNMIFTTNNLSTKLSGTRLLRGIDYQCKWLNFLDRIKMRLIFSKNYTEWNYSRYELHFSSFLISLLLLIPWKMQWVITKNTINYLIGENKKYSFFKELHELNKENLLLRNLILEEIHAKNLNKESILKIVKV